MPNIPTDLLRTLVAVVDLHSFTKAANSLGVTQPAVSAQIKRLQQLIGADLFDRSGQSMMLTSHGERVVARARRLLSLNETTTTAYVDEERVAREIAYARRMFSDHGWPVIDVTRRSIEETAAAIINLVAERREQQAQA